MPRDTDADWRRLAETDPYFAVLTHERFHCERMDDARTEEFYASGPQDVATALNHIRSRAPDFQPQRALDFGCGVGRLSLVMAAHAADVVGLDVAPAMLAKARAAAAARRVRNVRFSDALTPSDRFDWINSYIVFQHVPPQRGYSILADLLARLELGGFCSLHLTLFRAATSMVPAIETGAHWFCDGERMRLLVEQEPKSVGTMQMFDYDLNLVLALMVSNHVEPYALQMTDHGGYHGAWVFGQRDRAGYWVQPNRHYSVRGTDSFCRFLGSGWSAPEGWGVWTDGSEATIELLLPPNVSGGTVRIEGRDFVIPDHHPDITVSVDANDTSLGTQRISADTAVAVFRIPARLADKHGLLRLRFTIEQPRSPRELGVSDDSRALGFGLEGITLET